MKTKKSVIAVLSAAMIMLIPCSEKAYADKCREIPAEKAAVSKAADSSEVSETQGKFEGYSVYEKYGLIYDNENDCYTYNGSVVRFFNDPVAGASFTNFFTGTVDIEAVYDEENNLIGIKECSKEAYDRHTKKQEKFKKFAR